MRALREVQSSGGGGVRCLSRGFDEFGRRRLRRHLEFLHGERLRTCAPRDIAIEPHFVVAVLADEVRAPNLAQHLDQCRHGRPHERGEVARVLGAPECRAREAPRPGKKFQQATRRNVEHAAERKQLAPEPEQQSG